MIFRPVNLVAPKSRSDIEKRFKKLASGKKLAPNYEFFAISKDGREFEVEVSVSYIKYKQGTAVQGIIRDITERKQSERTLRKWLLFEKMVADISSGFIGIYDLDERINESLANISKLSEADRAYVFLINENGTKMDNTHEWCTETVTPQIENLQDLPLDMFPWRMDKLQKNEEIYITDVSKLPAEAAAEKQILESQDIKSLIVLPLFVEKGLTGFVGFDNVVKTGKWREEDKTILRVFSEIIGNALERQQKEELIQNSLREKDVLLNEIHHRVRNNMNVITSLLELQTRRIQNKQQAIEAFKKSTNRIYSMALIHKQLYDSESYSKIEFKKFIETLAQKLFLSYNAKKQVVLDKKNYGRHAFN